MSDESLHDATGSHESTVAAPPPDRLDPPPAPLHDPPHDPPPPPADQMHAESESHQGAADLPVAASGTDAQRQPVETAEKVPASTWFQCRTPTHIGALNVMAKDVDAARERFKKALGIRFTPHEITIVPLLPDFTPSDKDKELEELIDKNDTPAK